VEFSKGRRQDQNRLKIVPSLNNGKPSHLLNRGERIAIYQKRERVDRTSSRVPRKGKSVPGGRRGLRPELSNRQGGTRELFVPPVWEIEKKGGGKKVKNRRSGDRDKRRIRKKRGILTLIALFEP